MQNTYFVDGVRTPFGKAGEKGVYWNTRADDLVVKAMIGLLDRNQSVPKDAIDDVAIAATTQVGDQGLTIGRTSWQGYQIRFLVLLSTGCVLGR
jgi:acetyl-CoA acyltransferase